MPPRCPNGTRRSRKTGNCEAHIKKSHNKTVKALKPVTLEPVTLAPAYTFNEFCKISSELYGLSYTYFHNHGGDMRHLYYVYNKNRKQFVFPKDLKKIMIGTPSDRFHTRTPYTGKAIKNKNGISANVTLKDINKNELYGTKVNDVYAKRYKPYEK